jgi:ABC-type glutathione transport system ATPase component
VPRLLEVVQQASRELGFQVIYISHHDRATLERYCDKVYQLRPGADGVIATEESTRAMTED